MNIQRVRVHIHDIISNLKISRRLFFGIDDGADRLVADHSLLYDDRVYIANKLRHDQSRAGGNKYHKDQTRNKFQKSGHNHSPAQFTFSAIINRIRTECKETFFRPPAVRQPENHSAGQ